MSAWVHTVSLPRLSPTASSFLRKGQSHSSYQGLVWHCKFPIPFGCLHFRSQEKVGDGADGTISFCSSALPSLPFFFLNRSGVGGSKHYCPGSSFRLWCIPPLSTLADAQLTCLHPVKFWVLLFPCIQTHQGSQLKYDGLLSLEISSSSLSCLHCSLISI